MTKEIKLAATLRGVALPNVYTTDALKLGEYGALVVYTHPVTSTEEVDGEEVKTTSMKTDSVAIRFSLADDPMDEATLHKLSASINSLMMSYLGTDADFALTALVVGELNYQFEYHKNMLLAITKVKLGEQVIGEAHYLGTEPTPTSTPSQRVWLLDPVPTALKNTVDTVLPLVIQKEMYGG